MTVSLSSLCWLSWANRAHAALGRVTHGLDTVLFLRGALCKRSGLISTLVAMCGIVGYTGPRDAQEVLVAGLRRMEYRGYDSAGIAIVADGRLAVAKKAGKLANLEAELDDRHLPASHQGIGHTRWATHGAPNDTNAHQIGRAHV